MTSSIGGVFSDEPIGAEIEDRLGRSGFADRVVEVLNGVAKETSSSVVGLIGPWGSGKTSLLHLVGSRLRRQDQWVAVKFNPWVTADVEGLTREFIATVQSAFPAGSPIRKRLGDYARRAAPFTSLAAAFGADPSKAFEAAANWLSGDGSLETAREELELDLRKSAQNILVMIDDVDRLHADELAALLKLVRLVGRLPNVYYVLAYDEITLLDVLGQSDVANGNPARALAFLDKIVQVRLDLPQAPQVLLDQMIEETLERVVHVNQLELTREDLERFGFEYHYILRRVLVEPRHIKRYFGQIEAVLPLVATEVNFVDFALLTFIRTFYPQVFRLLRRSQSELTGTELSFDDGPAGASINRWRSLLSEAERGLTPDDVELLVALISRLFPALDRRNQRSGGQRVGSSEYFGRYFQLAVAPDDVSDADVRAALDEAKTGTLGVNATALLDRMAVAAEPIVDKLGRSSTPDPKEARALLGFAALVIAAAPSSGLFRRAKRVPAYWMANLFDTADLSEPSKLLDELVATVSVRDVAYAFNRTRKGRHERGMDLSQGQIDFESELAREIESELNLRSADPPSAHDGTLGLLVDWSMFVDDDYIKEWLRAKIDENNPWTPSEVAGLFCGVSSSGDAKFVDDVSMAAIERFVGVQFLLDRFSPTQDETIAWQDRVEASWPERLRRAHHRLALENCSNQQNSDLEGKELGP